MKQPIRYSLLNLLLVTTIVALAIALYLARSRLARVEAESNRLRNLVGELTVSDPGQVHVISVPTGGAMNWRWRIYLPGGHDFGVFTFRGQLDPAGMPGADSHSRYRIGGQSNPNEPREIILDVVLGKTDEGDRCLWISENGRDNGQITFGPSLPSWADGQTMIFSEKVAGRLDTVSAAATVPLGMISLNGFGPGGATSKDAVLIWIGKYEKNPTPSLRARGVLP